MFKKNNSLHTYFLFCSEKKLKKATDRNRVKRVLRALIKNIIYPNGYNIAIISNLNLNKISHLERVSSLQNLISKIKS